MASYTSLQIEGEVTVERVEGPKMIATNGWIFLLMGLTGAGKSHFIESLAPHARLGIAGNQLESVTHEIVAYRVVNARNISGQSLYLIDTPGFCDRKMSEMRVVKMVEEWMKTSGQSSIQRILFFDRITDIRTAGSKKRSMDIFKAITGQNTSLIITIVTTMWDQLANEESVKRANVRYDALKAGYWHDFVGAGCHVYKFENNQESALHLLGFVCGIDPVTARWFEFEKSETIKGGIKNSPFCQLLHQNLVQRIDQLQQKCYSLDDELSMPSTSEDPVLRDTLLREKAEAELDLNVMLREMETEFGPLDVVRPATPLSNLTSRAQPASQTPPRRPKPRSPLASAKAEIESIFRIRR
ncbi:hypothetical protein BJ165DRAFT_371629 [Panaeolus papilionaceus]|nr:hypothetical protein BJ165DRAFT_371629 [Panaeolus papilionaceus]